VEAVRLLAETAAVLVVQGTQSHDVPGSLDLLRKVKGTHTIHVSTAPEILHHRPALWDTELLPHIPGSAPQLATHLIIASLPEFTPTGLRSVADGMGEASLALAFKQIVNDLIRNARTIADQHSVALIVAAHGAVAGAVSPTGHVFDGTGLAYNKSDLAPALFSAFGHVHKPQILHNRTVYAGSLVPQDFSETGPHGVVLIEFDHTSDFKQAYPQPAITWLPVTFTPVTTLDEGATIDPSTITGTRVRVKITVKEGQSPAAEEDALREKLLAAGATEVVFEHRTEGVYRVRAEGISRAQTNFDKLRAWAQAMSIPIPEGLENELALLEANTADEAARLALSAIEAEDPLPLGLHIGPGQSPGQNLLGLF
jgi:exonuclease SbcD